MMTNIGFISKAKDKVAITDISGHSKMKAYYLANPNENGSRYLTIVLGEFEPGGGIEPHYHEITPPCDHAYYVINGEIEASIGNRKERVGSDTLIYCTTDVIHSLRNVGKSPAKLLRIGAAADGKSSGNAVFV